MRLNRSLAKILDPVDAILDEITTYRTVLYVLISIDISAVILSALNQVPFNWYEILGSTIWLLAVCWTAGNLFSRFLKIPRNKESDLISALILSLIFSPANSGKDFLMIGFAGFMAIASKYVLTIYRRHIFNPAAFGAFAAGALLNTYPSWWVGTKFLLPFVFIGGWLVLRKMKRFTLVSIFIALSLLIIILQNLSGSSLGDISNLVWLTVSATPLLFFAYIMLIEPLTSPSSRMKYIPYAVLVSLLYSISRFKLTPQEALLIGNVFSFLICRDKRFRLILKERLDIAKDIYQFNFNSKDTIHYKPGQYMEWTMPIRKVDSRGNRRYFTISSSPTEGYIGLATKFSEPSSSFKQKLLQFKKGDKLVASHISGSFTLPDRARQKIVLIAGGIGVTPYRSMVKYIIDKKLNRDAILLYAAADPEEFAFKDLFKQAFRNGLKTNYIITNPEMIPKNWNGLRGKLDAKLIEKSVPDYKERIFYLSGPHGLVKSVETELINIGVKQTNIKTDYFPGYG